MMEELLEKLRVAYDNMDEAERMMSKVDGFDALRIKVVKKDLEYVTKDMEERYGK